MDAIKELIISLIPTLTSVASIVIMVLTFIKNAKGLVDSKTKELQEQAKQLAVYKEKATELTDELAKYREIVTQSNEIAQKELLAIKAELAAVHKEVIETVKQNEAIQKVDDELQTIKAQNRVLLNKGE